MKSEQEQDTGRSRFGERSRLIRGERACRTRFQASPKMKTTRAMIIGNVCIGRTARTAFKTLKLICILQLVLRALYGKWLTTLSFAKMSGQGVRWWSCRIASRIIRARRYTSFTLAAWSAAVFSTCTLKRLVRRDSKRVFEPRPRKRESFNRMRRLQARPLSRNDARFFLAGKRHAP